MIMKIFSECSHDVKGLFKDYPLPFDYLPLDLCFNLGMEIVWGAPTFDHGDSERGLPQEEDLVLVTQRASALKCCPTTSNWNFP